MNIKRVKFVITGYYDIDMSKAQEDYDTTNPDEMLAIDRSNIENYPQEMIDSLDEPVSVVLSWEN